MEHYSLELGTQLGSADQPNQHGGRIFQVLLSTSYFVRPTPKALPHVFECVDMKLPALMHNLLVSWIERKTNVKILTASPIFPGDSEMFEKARDGAQMTFTDGFRLSESSRKWME